MLELTQQKALIFRITHIDNIPWILDNGLHCRKSPKKDGQFHEIGNQELIGKRADHPVSIHPGGTLGDYVPFYFTPYSPMLLNIKTGYNGVKKTPMADIAILVSSLPKLVQDDVPFVFADRHALLATAIFTSDLKDLSLIDWKILQARDFKRNPNDPAKFERYQAEAIVYRSIPITSLLGIACNGDAQVKRLTGEVESRSLSLTVSARPDWYN